MKAINIILFLVLVFTGFACSPRSFSTQETELVTAETISPATIEVSVEPAQPTLKSADSDTPAAGICGRVEGGLVEVTFGSGPDGLPLGGRCLQVTPKQQLRLVNATAGQVRFSFGAFEIDLAPGAAQLLDKAVGEYLAPGAHLLPNAPEIWLVEE